MHWLELDIVHASFFMDSLLKTLGDPARQRFHSPDKDSQDDFRTLLFKTMLNKMMWYDFETMSVTCQGRATCARSQKNVLQGNNLL